MEDGVECSRTCWPGGTRSRQPAALAHVHAHPRAGHHSPRRRRSNGARRVPRIASSHCHRQGTRAQSGGQTACKTSTAETRTTISALRRHRRQARSCCASAENQLRAVSRSWQSRSSHTPFAAPTFPTRLRTRARPDQPESPRRRASTSRATHARAQPPAVSTEQSRTRYREPTLRQSSHAASLSGLANRLRAFRPLLVPLVPVSLLIFAKFFGPFFRPSVRSNIDFDNSVVLFKRLI